MSSDAISALVAKFHGKSIESVEQFNRDDLNALLQYADKMKQMVDSQGTCQLLADKVMAALFYEPSTRTSSSFQTAMMRLGGHVLPITDVANSSVSKGETVEDTIQCLQSYCDMIVQRHPSVGAMKRAVSVATVPIINAGDGVGEHPTQALLDLYTIVSETGAKVDGLTITMLGDLKHGRTVHSLSKLLTNFTNMTVNLVSPPSLAMPEEYVNALTKSGAKVQQLNSLDTVIASTDILYVTRVQKERFASQLEYESVADAFIITPETLSLGNAKSTMRILHPLPRVNEIHPSVDADPRAAYFRQMRCGLFVRMALLATVMGRTL